MADKSKNLPAVAAKKTKKQITLAVSRVLKKHKFSPLERLILEVYPYLNPEKQADILLSIMPYLYPKLKAAEVGPRKKSTIFQVNNQIVNPGQARPIDAQLVDGQEAPFTIDDLMRIAASDPTKP